MRLKQGDKIIVIAGKDKGREGKIEKILPKKNRVLVPGINMYKKHVRKTQTALEGGIIEFAKPLPASNVMLVCPGCGEKTRIGYTVVKGQKDRVCKKCEKILN